MGAYLQLVVVVAAERIPILQIFSANLKLNYVNCSRCQFVSVVVQSLAFSRKR